MKRFIKAVFPVLVAARVITEPSDVGTKQNVGLDVRDSSALSESLEEGYQVRTTKSDDSSLPRVNLGYEVHQASSHVGIILHPK